MRSDKNIKKDLRFLADQVGGVNSIEIHPRIANPFINDRKGYVNLADPGPFKIESKHIVSASLNLDNLRMRKKAPKNQYRRKGHLPQLSPRSDRNITLNSCIIEGCSDKSSDTENKFSRPTSGFKKM